MQCKIDKAMHGYKEILMIFIKSSMLSIWLIFMYCYLLPRLWILIGWEKSPKGGNNTDVLGLPLIVLLKREHIIQLINVNMYSSKYTVYIVHMLLFPFYPSCEISWFFVHLWTLLQICQELQIHTRTLWFCSFFLRISFPLLILGVVLQVYSLSPSHLSLCLLIN
jgi:hypothetical protein